MKIFSFTARLTVALCVSWLTGSPAFAQMPSGGSPAGINAAFLKLFGNVNAFTARVDAEMLDATQKEAVRMPMDFATADGKVRLEINVEEMQSKNLPPNAIAAYKARGIARMISIFRPDKKLTYVIYPGVQSYINIPLAKADADTLDKGFKVEKSPLGKATLDGHACVKNKVTVRSGQNSVLEAVTWNATDLKDFPIQIELKQKQDTVRMHFTQMRFTKPDAKQFELPAAYGKMNEDH